MSENEIFGLDEVVSRLSLINFIEKSWNGCPDLLSFFLGHAEE